MTDRSEAALQAEMTSDALDAALLEIGSLPRSAAKTAVVSQIEAAHRALASVIDIDPDLERHLTHLEQAEHALARIIGTLRQASTGQRGRQLADSLEPFRRALGEARAPTIDRLVRGAPIPTAPSHAGGTRISIGVPALFVCDEIATPKARRPHTMANYAPPAIDVDALFAELHRSESIDLDAALAIDDPAPPNLVQLRPPRPSDDIDQRGAAGELAQLRRLARDCLEGIGALGNLRNLDDDDRWDEATGGFETRLLTKLDALMTLGDAPPGGGPQLTVLNETLRYCSDGPTADAFRAFAGALVLSCNDSEAAARAAIVEMRRNAPSAAPAHAAGMALGSGTAIDEALRRGCREEREPRRLAAMLEALRRRRARCGDADSMPELVPLLQHADDDVRVQAIRCLGATDTSLLETALDDPEEAVVCAAVQLQLEVAPRAARDRIRAELTADLEFEGSLARPTRARYLMLLAIAGAPDDGSLLQRAASQDPATIEPLGWHGDPAHAAMLIALLGEGPERAQAASRALTRIAGPELVIETSSTNWDELATDWSDGRRRLGHLFSGRIIADELAQPGARMKDRAWLAWELRLAGVSESLDVHDWYARQQRTLASLSDATIRRAGADRRLLGAVPEGAWLTAVKPAP
jgi:hypothetical protein